MNIETIENFIITCFLYDCSSKTHAGVNSFSLEKGGERLDQKINIITFLQILWILKEFLKCNILSSISYLSFMYVNVTVEICVFRRAFLFTDSFIFLHFIYPAVIYIVYITVDINIYIATSWGFNGTLDPAFRFFDYFVVACHVLQYSFLYSLVWSQGLTSTQPWLFMNCSIKPLVSF